ncbi:MAG: hypothetical protein IT247_03750, partial [Bacteroidia bacterium]|nr:hypothetical protein [Bacteroidia bacterium]
EGGLYILNQNELYSVVKFNHSGYGPNSKTYDLLFFDKQALQLNVLIAFADMESNLIEVAGIELHGDTVEVIGSRFLQKDNRRTAFKMHFVKGKLLNDVQTAFPPEPPLPPKYEYFDGYECIGKLGDSAFAFSHRKIFATVSPWTQVSYFNERKVYTYDYLKKDLKTYEFPRFGNSNKKVYEEVQFTQDSFRVTGLYVDTFQTNTKITGIYYSDLYSQTMSYCPIKQLSDTQWVEKGIDEELAWNKNTFNLNNCIIDIHELSDQNLLIACYRPKGVAWAKKLVNHSTRGPYPNYTQVGNSVVVLSYNLRDNHSLLPLNKSRNYNMEVVYVQLFCILPDGSVMKFAGEPIKEHYNIFFYPESLIELDPKSFGVFYYDKQKASVSLYKFSLN